MIHCTCTVAISNSMLAAALSCAHSPFFWRSKAPPVVDEIANGQKQYCKACKKRTEISTLKILGRNIGIVEKAQETDLLCVWCTGDMTEGRHLRNHGLVFYCKFIVKALYRFALTHACSATNECYCHHALALCQWYNTTIMYVWCCIVINLTHALETGSAHQELI